MNERQLDVIEGALFCALAYLQEHPPYVGFVENPVLTTDRAHEEQQQVIDKLRSAHTLVRAWRGLIRSSSREQTVDALPGQMVMPGVNSGNTKK